MADSQKQTVQWFPGHMAKTRRKIKENLPLVDAVVELVDARIPVSSRNPELDELTSSKPRIILLNKCDVADAHATSLWTAYFESSGQYAMAVDCRTGKGLNRFDSLVKAALAEKKRPQTAKALKADVVAHLTARKNEPDSVRRLFHKEEVRYAAD